MTLLLLLFILKEKKREVERVGDLESNHNKKSSKWV